VSRDRASSYLGKSWLRSATIPHGGFHVATRSEPALQRLE
jgi:hypothetical protein